MTLIVAHCGIIDGIGRITDRARVLWRTGKSHVQAGRGCWLERVAYRLLSGFVARNKRRLGASDLRDLAIWLMYHPELNVLPCDGWRLVPPPAMDAAELAQLKARHAAEMMAVKHRLNLVEEVRLADVKTPLKAQLAKHRVAVHVHAFFPDVLPRILSALRMVPVPFDLFVSVPEGVAVCPELEKFGNCTVRQCPNRGRDIAPLLCTFGKELSEYDYVAHFHTKKSVHEQERRDWLGFTLSHLLGSAEDCLRVLSLLELGYGMVAAPDYLPVSEDPTGWMRNLTWAEDFVDRSGMDVDLRRDFTPIAFPQGSMFWARGDFLRRFFALNVSFEDFPPEPIGVDGSPAHALERLFFIWGQGTGLKVARLEANRQ